MSALLAGAVVFLTSAAVLVAEILASRILAPFVGVTLETYTAIIGTVLAGISLGSAVGGRLADRRPPSSLLGPTIMLGGVLLLLTLPVVNLLGPGLAALGGGPVASVMLALTGFFLPATVLSAVTPMVVKLRLSSLEETGATVGRLSALSTAGAIVGTFATGFLLVATAPTRATFLAIAAALVAGGLLLHLRLRGTSPVPLAALLALGLVGATGTVAVAGPCDVQSAYYCVRVIDGLEPCDTGRTLYLDTLRHSCVYLDDPERLDFTYAQIVSDAVATLPDGPLETLHIGGGGFTMPRYLQAVRPGSRDRVLELDPTLVDVAVEELGLVPGPDLEVVVGDARTALDAEPDDAYDLVIEDAFGGLAVPWHLTTREVTEAVQRTLRPGGLYAVNLIDYPPLGFARAEVATLDAVFDHVAVVGPRERLQKAEGGNFVLFASDEPLDVEGLLARNAERGDDDAALSTPQELERFVAGAPVLTDDYAPVDQLLTPVPLR